jgi:hypothetical protein
MKEGIREGGIRVYRPVVDSQQIKLTELTQRVERDFGPEVFEPKWEKNFGVTVVSMREFRKFQNMNNGALLGKATLKLVAEIVDDALPATSDSRIKINLSEVRTIGPGIKFGSGPLFTVLLLESSTNCIPTERESVLDEYLYMLSQGVMPNLGEYKMHLTLGKVKDVWAAQHVCNRVSESLPDPAVFKLGSISMQVRDQSDNIIEL